jgi:hypothetical protein
VQWLDIEGFWLQYPSVHSNKETFAGNSENFSPPFLEVSGSGFGDDADNMRVLVIPRIAAVAGVTGTLGDFVISSQGAAGERHFVTPKKTEEIADDYVIFEASGIDVDDNFERFFEWGSGGEAVQSKASRQSARLSAM